MLLHRGWFDRGGGTYRKEGGLFVPREVFFYGVAYEKVGLLYLQTGSYKLMEDRVTIMERPRVRPDWCDLADWSQRFNEQPEAMSIHTLLSEAKGANGVLAAPAQRQGPVRVGRVLGISAALAAALAATASLLYFSVGGFGKPTMAPSHGVNTIGYTTKAQARLNPPSGLDCQQARRLPAAQASLG